MGCGSSQQPAAGTQGISPYELEILKNETRYTEDEIKIWYEAFMDENPSGDMDKQGFIKLYATLYPNGTVNDFSEHLFVAYDKDSSGLIDFKEFLHVMNIANKGTSDEKLAWAFSLYDTDGSGEICRDEVTQITTVSIRHFVNPQMPFTDWESNVHSMTVQKDRMHILCPVCKGE